MKEYLNRKRINCLCTYNTVCTTIIPVLDVTTKEEAIEQAKKKFKKWNDNWIKNEGGYPKDLIKIEVIDK